MAFNVRIGSFRIITYESKVACNITYLDITFWNLQAPLQIKLIVAW